MKYKVGDKVRIKATKEEGVVRKINNDYYEVQINNVYDNFREVELCDPAPIKIGDIIMETRKTLIGTALVFGSYFPANYGANVDTIGMQVCAMFITIAMLFAGLILLISSNS